MDKTHKFYKLYQYFEKSSNRKIKLSFSEIENIIGSRLAESKRYKAYWSNSESHSISKAWLNAGYTSERVDIPNQCMEFKKFGIGIERAVNNIRTFHNITVKQNHHRYRSWFHCYRQFTDKRNRRDSETVDYLALQLAFYLASWGMYRGSSFLLKNDYRIHIPVVELIIDKKYDSLCGISAKKICTDQNLMLIEDLNDKIFAIYQNESPSDKIYQASDILITKILLGTLGCVPAYDSYLKQSLEKNCISPKFRRRSIQQITNYYLKFFDEFESLRHQLSADGITYPPMKLMDMCYFQDSYGLNNKLSIL